jgi:hypothetical protein
MKYLVVNLESFQTGDVPDVVKNFLEKHPEPFIVLDESSKIKSNNASIDKKKSKRTQAIQKLSKYGHRAILTGTFISKSPVNAYDQMCFLHKNYFGEDIFKFQQRFCLMVFLPIGRGIRTLISEDIYRSVHQRLKKASVRGPDYLQDVIESISTFYKLSERKVRHILANPEYTPFIDLPELYKRIGNDVMIVKKEDALDLPPKLYTTLKVQLKPKAAKMYKSFVDMNFVDNLAIKKGLPLFYSLQDLCNGYYPTLTDPEDPESEKLLVPQEENPKIDMLLEKISEIDLSCEQVVVWSNRKLFLQDIKKSLDAEEINSCTYDGDTPTDERERIRKEFQEGKIRVFIGNQKSGAFGLDFLKAANYVFFMSNDYSVETREQAEDRVHRGGIISAKNIFDVVVEGSVDERVTKSLLLGKELIHSGAMHRSVFDLKEVIF